MRKFLLASTLALLCSSAEAQITFITPAGNYAGSAVPMCDNGSAVWVPCTTANPVPVSMASGAGPYPTGATPLTASATGTTASITATLAGVGGKTTHICGFSMSAAATLGGSGDASVTGTITGTLNYVQGIGTLSSVQQLQQTYSPCIPASATNTGISVISAGAGTGGNAAVSAWGYQL